jgi:hypothetical protein
MTSPLFEERKDPEILTEIAQSHPVSTFLRYNIAGVKQSCHDKSRKQALSECRLDADAAKAALLYKQNKDFCVYSSKWINACRNPPGAKVQSYKFDELLAERQA